MRFPLTLCWPTHADIWATLIFEPLLPAFIFTMAGHDQMNYKAPRRCRMGRRPAPNGWWYVEEVKYINEMSVEALQEEVNALLVDIEENWQPAGEFQAYEVAYKGATTTTFTQKMARWAYHSG
jgi:hypothetical protein